MAEGSIAKHFGCVIRRHRVRLGLSQEQLADMCGIHRTYVGSIERGEKTVTIATADKLARSLGVRLSDLIVELEDQLIDYDC